MVHFQISGSVALDSIMVFQGRFRDHILPDQVHMLNVAFLTPELRQEYGGCAANIAYNLKALQTSVSILGAVGRDGKAYRDRLLGMGIGVDQLLVQEDHYTAQAFITTDLDDNQITAFHPGAMNTAHQARVLASPGIGIVSPNGKQAMLDHAQQFSAAGIPFIFDPGQAMPIFTAEELLSLTRLASWLTLNDYESELFARTTGQTMSALRELLRPHPQGGVVVTLGAQGSEVFAHGHEKSLISPLPVSQAVDPTGCGDAYRAGLLASLGRGASLADAARLASLMGGIKVESRGAQNHTVDPALLRSLWSEHHAEHSFPL